MDYEKKYKEAFEKIKQGLAPKDGCEISGVTRGFLEEVFPELKESENEKTKRILLSISNKMAMHLSDIFTEEEFQCYDAWSNDWLEKQGNKEEPQVYETENGEVITYSETDGYKLEPKFKVGDWIVSNFNTVCYVESISEKNYHLRLNDGYHEKMSINYVDRNFHLWTIQDAKDGDLLQLCEVTAIFKEYIGNEHCICYCSFCKDGGFEIPMENGEDNVYGCYDDTIPATKEQRDLLFQKMKEAGYEWDTEKKEPKKIHVIDEGKSEMDYCFTKMMNDEKVNPAWSEDDEDYLLDVNFAINDCFDEGYAEELRNWLKTLKDRMKGE